MSLNLQDLPGEPDRAHDSCALRRGVPTVALVTVRGEPVQGLEGRPTAASTGMLVL